MTDGCGRTIQYLRLSVTDLCNYRCRYCMPEAGVHKRPHRDILSVEECVEIGRAAVNCGVKKIRLTGGEPLVRGGILDICRGLSSIDGLEELCLTTNGSLLPELAASLRDAGVDRLNVSLDSLRPERFSLITRRGRLDDALAGLAAAERAGFIKLKCNVVLMGGFNDDEIVDFVALTEHKPWEIRFIELMPMGECAQWEKKPIHSGGDGIEEGPRPAAP
jgi:cyclic pyranopterin phosphate synthase